MRRLLQLGTLCLALAGLGMGCIVDAQGDTQGTGGAPPDDTSGGGVEGSGPGTSAPRGPYFGSPCGYDVQEFEMPDGSLVRMLIPLECDPFWVDVGDPPPERDPIGEVIQSPIDKNVPESPGY